MNNRTLMIIVVSFLFGFGATQLYVHYPFGEDKKTKSASEEVDVESDTEVQKPTRPSTKEVISGWLKNEAFPVVSKFNDYRETALNAPRMALGSHVNKLKEVRREWRKVSAPNIYMQDYRTLVDQYMEYNITAFTRFLGNQTNADLDMKLAAYSQALAGDYLLRVMKEFNIGLKQYNYAPRYLKNEKQILMWVNQMEKVYRGSEGANMLKSVSGDIANKRLEVMDRLKKYINEGPWIFEASKP